MIRKYIICLFIPILSCSDTYFCSEFEQKIMERCPDTNKVYEVKLSELTDFSWDSLVIRPNYNYDDMTLYAFMKDGEVVEDMTSSCTISFYHWNNSTGYDIVKYYYDTVKVVNKLQKISYQKYTYRVNQFGNKDTLSQQTLNENLYSYNVYPMSYNEEKSSSIDEKNP